MILSLAAFGYQPQAAAGAPVDRATAAEASVAAERLTAAPSAMPDCSDAIDKAKCCDETDGQKQNCAWDSGCAARCHFNLGIEPATYAPLVRRAPKRFVVIGHPQTQLPERPGPLFRPPIV